MRVGQRDAVEFRAPPPPLAPAHPHPLFQHPPDARAPPPEAVRGRRPRARAVRQRDRGLGSQLQLRSGSPGNGHRRAHGLSLPILGRPRRRPGRHLRREPRQASPAYDGHSAAYQQSQTGVRLSDGEEQTRDGLDCQPVRKRPPEMANIGGEAPKRPGLLVYRLRSLNGVILSETWRLLSRNPSGCGVKIVLGDELRGQKNYLMDHHGLGCFSSHSIVLVTAKPGFLTTQEVA
uniref:Uncharacterized protein n=1 Tax=Micrurus corallinus TaxID=54390 RepID=A0A2D4GGC6_MICCO